MVLPDLMTLHYWLLHLMDKIYFKNPYLFNDHGILSTILLPRKSRVIALCGQKREFGETCLGNYNIAYQSIII